MYEPLYTESEMTIPIYSTLLSLDEALEELFTELANNRHCALLVRLNISNFVM
jgi:hypothetical protein